MQHNGAKQPVMRNPCSCNHCTHSWISKQKLAWTHKHIICVKFRFRHHFINKSAMLMNTKLIIAEYNIIGIRAEIKFWT